MISKITQIGQVKIPVTGLAGSVDRYRRLLGLRLWAEFTEDGVVRGVALIDRQGRFGIALRDRAVCAGRPNLRGFEVVAFLPESHEVLEELAGHCDRPGIAHSGIKRTPAGDQPDIPDPDGTVLRFYDLTAPTEGFTGVESRDGQYVDLYDTPRLWYSLV